MHFRSHVSIHFNGPHAVMSHPHHFPICTNTWMPAHNAAHLQPIVPLPMLLHPIQPAAQFDQFPSTSDSRAVNINGLMVYSVAVPITPRRNDLCTLDHDHHSGCLMKSQDVRKQGALVRIAQEIVKNKKVEASAVTIHNEETPMNSAQPVEVTERPPTVAGKVEKAFPFLTDAKAVEAIRKKHPERFNVGVSATRLIRKHNLMEQKYKICTQSLPSAMLKMKFANKAIRYNRHAENLRTKLQNSEKETHV